MLRNRGQVSDVACVPALRQRSCSRARRLSWRLPAGARERYRAHCEQDGERERPAHPLIDGDETFVAATLERIAPAPGVPRRYLQTPRPTPPPASQRIGGCNKRDLTPFPASRPVLVIRCTHRERQVSARGHGTGRRQHTKGFQWDSCTDHPP